MKQNNKIFFKWKKVKKRKSENILYRKKKREKGEEKKREKKGKKGERSKKN